MCDVDSAVARSDFAQRDHFGGIGPFVGRIGQASGDPESAVLHAFGDQLAHTVQLGWCGCALFPTHRADAHRVVGYQERDVDRHPPLEAVQK